MLLVGDNPARNSELCGVQHLEPVFLRAWHHVFCRSQSFQRLWIEAQRAKQHIKAPHRDRFVLVDFICNLQSILRIMSARTSHALALGKSSISF